MAARGARAAGSDALIGFLHATTLKDICLAKCQSPFLFIQQQGGFRGDPAVTRWERSPTLPFI
jgi:predicted metal-binding membrane protein